MYPGHPGPFTGTCVNKLAGSSCRSPDAQLASCRALFYWRAAEAFYSYTPGSQSLPNVAIGPMRGSSGACRPSRKACTYARSCLIRCVYLISSADGPVTGDEDINVVRHALKQPQPNEVVLNRICGVQVGERTACQKACRRQRERRAPRSPAPHGLGMRLALNNPDSAIRRNRAVSAGRPVMRPNRSSGISSAISGGNPSATWPSSPRSTADPRICCAAGCTCNGALRRARRARARDPNQMRREACHNGLAQLAKVVCEAGHFEPCIPGSMSNTPALHNNGVVLVTRSGGSAHPPRPAQHGWLLPLVVATACRDRSAWRRHHMKRLRQRVSTKDACGRCGLRPRPRGADRWLLRLFEDPMEIGSRAAVDDRDGDDAGHLVGVLALGRSTICGRRLRRVRRATRPSIVSWTWPCQR